MRTEKVLWWFTLFCAVYLLTGLVLGGRSTWRAAGGTGIRDGAGWDWAMTGFGLAAVAGLVVGVLTRPRIVVPVIGAVGAMVAFAAAAYFAGSHWAGLLQGTTVPLGWDPARVEPGEITLVSPSRPQSFAVVATVAISWLKRAGDEW